MKLERKQKIILVCIFAFLIFDVAILCFRYATNMYSKATISFENSNISAQKMRALNKNSTSGRIAKSGYAYYKFTPDEQKIFANYYRQVGSVGVSVRIGVKNVRGEKFNAATQSEKLFYFGFLNSSDFTEKDKFIPSSKRVLSGCDLRSFIKNEKGLSVFDSSLALEKNLKEEELPLGFVIYSEYPIKIIDFLVEKAKVGFDFTKKIPFFGVSSNGGSFAGNITSFDFSGSASVFPVENTRYSIMPKLEIGFFPSENYGTEENQLCVKINAGGDELTIRRTQDVNEMIIQTSTLISPFSFYEISENANLVSKILMTTNDSSLLPQEANKVLSPLKSDPGLILSSKKSTWRANDYEVYEWDRFPGVLIFDTLNYKIQDDFFRRLAYFVEKVGFRGRLLTDEELGNMHGYNAHDYKAESLALFFTKAEEENFKLSEKEYLLKDILIKNKIIIPDSSVYKAGNGAVISISRESPDYLRRSLTAHEAWHGIFFTNEAFRNVVAAVYYTVDSNTMAFIKGYWASQVGLGYDQNDEYLMHNEFMAYLMQQPLSRTSQYFIHVANRGSVMNYQNELCDWVKSTNARTFEDACRILDSYAFDSWGLAAGRVALITR